MEIAFLILGIILGGAAAWFVAKSKFQSSGTESQTELLVERERVSQYKTELEELKLKFEEERQSVIQLNNNLSTTEADYRNLQEKLKEQKEELKNLQEKFALEFKSLANEIFEEKSKKFTDQNKVNISELLNPLKERISELKKR